jgi:ligand-binding SRPBCC domain-containing protein
MVAQASACVGPPGPSKWMKTGAKCGADFSLPRGFSPAFSPALWRFFNGAVTQSPEHFTNNMVKLEDLTVIQAPIERCFDLARSVEVHLAGNVHSGEQALAAGGITSGLIGLHQRVTWSAKHFGIWHKLTSEITAMDRPGYFQDAMTHGIFRLMRHEHFFRALSPNATEMKDVFCFAAPLPVLGPLAEAAFLRAYMQGLLRERNAVLKQIAESTEWRKYLPVSA